MKWLLLAAGIYFIALGVSQNSQSREECPRTITDQGWNCQ